MHDVKTAKLNVRNFMFIQNIFHQLSPEPLEGGGRRDPLFTPEVWLSRSLFIPREHISFRCEPREEKGVPRKPGKRQRANFRKPILCDPL